MLCPSLVVLDVGHGSAAVLFDKSGVVAVDAGKGGVLLDFLRAEGIKEVDALLISHADADHIRNAPDLLLDTDIVVKKVYVNTDTSKDSDVWEDFRIAMRHSRRRKKTVIHSQLTITETGELTHGDVSVEVLYPTSEDAVSGPGGKSVDGKPLNSNSMSAVIRLSTASGPMVLLAGDVEMACLETWSAEGTDPKAKVLVFPHHGGNPGKDDPVRFAEEIVKAVRPETAIFSIHRSQYKLPIPEVINAVRNHAPGVRVACTQLSTHCAAAVPSAPPSHLTVHEAHGRATNSCCAGSIVIDLTGIEPVLTPLHAHHTAFIVAEASTTLCRR
jgi:beta-lactamase superfamily II metal-dependent hydrolase